MAHVVTEKCNGCKFTDCVEVCPVACFYEMDLQVVIQPDECIDCMACVEVCPVHAIYADADVPAEYKKNIELNTLESNRSRTQAARQSQSAKMRCPLLTTGKRRSVI